MHMPPDLFLDCILLLVSNNGPRNKKVVSELVEMYQKSDRRKASQGESEDSLLNFYVRFLKRLLSDDFDSTNVHDVKRYLLQMKSDVALEKRKDLYELFSDVVTNQADMTVEKLERIVKNVQNHLVWNRMNQAARSLFGRLGKTIRTPDVDETKGLLSEMLTDMETTLQEIRDDSNVDQTTATMDEVDFDDESSILGASKKYNKRTDEEGFTLGLQGLNRMFGKNKKVSRGESVLFSALTHHYKSGMLQSIASWLVTLNTPLIEDGKRPMVLMVSLENEAYQNFVWMAHDLYRARTGEDPSMMPDEDLAAWAHKAFSEKGFRLKILRYQPDDFGYEEVVALVSHYESIGFSIQAMVIDYLGIARRHDRGTTHTTTVANHLAIRHLYSRVLNFTKSKGITLFTAHQLNRKAQELANSGRVNFVKHLNIEHLADSVDVQREVDCAIFLAIEKSSDRSYLTMYRGKRRYENPTIPEAHKYCAYRFHETLGIQDDVHGPPGYVKTSIHTDELDEESGKTLIPPSDSF